MCLGIDGYDRETMGRKWCAAKLFGCERFGYSYAILRLDDLIWYMIVIARCII